GGGVEAFGFAHHLVGGDEDELGVGIDEFFDQPGTGNAVDLDAFAGDPAHGNPPWRFVRARSEAVGRAAESRMGAERDMRRQPWPERAGEAQCLGAMPLRSRATAFKPDPAPLTRTPELSQLPAALTAL